MQIQDGLVVILRSVFQSIYENISQTPFTDIAFAMSVLENWLEDNTQQEGLLTEE